MLFSIFGRPFFDADELLQYLKYHSEEELQNYSSTDLQDMKESVTSARERTWNLAAGSGLLCFIMLMGVMAGAIELFILFILGLALCLHICFRYVWPLDDESSRLTTALQKKQSDSI